MQPRAETVIIAASFEQAGILFDTALAYGAGRVTGMHYRILNSQNRKLIEHLPSGARLRVMSSDPKRAHGIAPALILADEPAQWPTGTGEQMVAALRTSRGKIAGSRFIALGTRPGQGHHWFARLLRAPGETAYCQVHAATDLEDANDREQWLLANPCLLYTSPSPRDS